MLQHGWTHSPRNFGVAGVCCFFALSGFVITSGLIIEERQHKKVNLGAFYARRMLRIWPLYFFAIGLMAIERLIPGIAAATPGNPQYAYSLTFTRTLLGRRLYFDPMGHFWSLSIEEQFYLVWPLLFIGLQKLHFRVAVLPLVPCRICPSFSILNALAD